MLIYRIVIKLFKKVGLFKTLGIADEIALLFKLANVLLEINFHFLASDVPLNWIFYLVIVLFQ
jgi:hypothetical protein